MTDVISLLDSDDDVVVPLDPAYAQAAPSSRTAARPPPPSRPVIPDLSDDDDFLDRFPSLLGLTASAVASTSSGAAAKRSSRPLMATTARSARPPSDASARSLQSSSSVSRRTIDIDDIEIVDCSPPTAPPATSGAQRQRPAATHPPAVVNDDEVEIIEVVSATLPAVPASRPIAPGRSATSTAPAFPFDLSRPLASQVNAVASGSGTSCSRLNEPVTTASRGVHPSSPARPARRVDSGVAGLGLSRTRTASDLDDSADNDADDDDDDEDLERMIAEIERVTSACRSSQPGPSATSGPTVDEANAAVVAKRKKYKLDSSDGEDDAAHLSARRAGAANAKDKGKRREKRVKGQAGSSAKDQGKERSATVGDSDAQDGVPPPPKRKRKTADEIAYDAAVKARAKQDKAEETARRKAEKEIYNEANKLRSRATAMHEILLELPKQLEGSRSIVARVKPELVDKLDESGVRINDYAPDASAPANVLRFKRELKAVYDERTRHFIAVPTRIQPESTAIILLSADDAAAHVRGRTWLSLPGRVRAAAGLSPKGQVVIIIHGLVKLYKLEKSAADRAYDARVRGISTSAGAAAARRAAVASPEISKDEMEKALVQLQVVDRSFINRVETDKEMVDHIMSFAGDVAHRPYKLIEYSHLPFCPDSAIAKGANPGDTLCKMLSTVKGVTPAMTLAVLKAFGSFRGLMDAYDRAKDDKDADLLLANLIAEHKVDGTPNARYINKAKSAQIRRMLRVEDPRALWA